MRIVIEMSTDKIELAARKAAVMAKNAYNIAGKGLTWIFIAYLAISVSGLFALIIWASFQNPTTGKYVSMIIGVTAVLITAIKLIEASGRRYARKRYEKYMRKETKTRQNPSI